MASSSAGIKIIRRIDLFFFANREILESKFAEKIFQSVAKVLIKDLVWFFRIWPVQFPVNKKYPAQHNYKGDLLDQRQERNECIAHHDKVVQTHQGDTQKPGIEKPVIPAFIEPGKGSAKGYKPQKACGMYDHIMQLRKQ